ncbi:MAG: glycosyltransferase family 9 protein [Rhodospirillales bacterium]|nr:glycosyltransferase family 9 protein [Rhodospirillales bacterium]
MKTETMRIIDRYVGIPVCIVLSWLAPLITRKQNNNVVVVCKFFGIGSICLSYPLIYELKKQGKEIVYLTFASNEPMVRFLGVDRCITINSKSFGAFVFDVLKAVWQLRRIKPGAFLNLEFFSKFSAIMSVLSGAAVRSGFYMLHSAIGKLYTHRTNLNLYRPVSENFLNVGTMTGVVSDSQKPDFYPDTFHIPDTAKLPSQVSGNYIVVNAESSETIRELKSWPTENWVRLIISLREERPEYSLVLIGANAGEIQNTELSKLIGANQGIINCVGRTSFDEFTGLIANAALVVTIDSGPVHLSALMKRPTVAMFGPETPTLYGHKLPWVRSFYKGLICSPCLAIYDAKKSVLDCQDNKCMKQITPDEVLQATFEMLPTSDGKARQIG